MNSDIILAIVVLGGLWGFFLIVAYGSDVPDDYLPYRDLMDDPDVPEHVKEEFRKMSDCPRCKHHNSVRIVEWPLPQKGTPTHIEIQGLCIMCGYESRRFCVPVDYSNKEVDQVLAYMAMTREQQEAEEIELLPCRCGRKPTIIEINTALQGATDYWWAIECPACFRKTLWKHSKKEARYEWQVLTLAGVVLHPERATKIERLETLVSLLRERVVCLEEQLDSHYHWINMHRSCTKPEEKNG